MNIGKGFSLALMPIAALLLITIIYSLWNLFDFIPVLNICTGIIRCLMLPLTLLIMIALLVYIGYLIAKGGLELVDAAVVGGISGALSVFISQLIGIVLTALGFGAMTAGSLIQNNEDALAKTIFSGFFVGLGMFAQIFCMFVWIVVGFVVGAVLAAIGALIAGTKK